MNGNHGWRDALIDAGIAAGGAFFGVLGGIAVTQLRAEPVTELAAGGIAAGTAFFFSLAAARQRPRVQAPPP